jgi:hypothetical protein
LCYVNTGQGPRSVWMATVDRPVESVEPSLKPIRLGAFGDPAMLPYRLLKSLVKGRRHAGYTHQWHRVKRIFGRLLMASVDDVMADREGCSSAELRARAKSKGYRTFRVIRDRSELLPGEIECPNSTHGVQCVDCGLCSGRSGVDDRRKDIAVVVHGASKGLY